MRNSRMAWTFTLQRTRMTRLRYGRQPVHGRAGEKHESELTCIDTSTEEVRYHTAELQCFLLNKSIRAAFFRFVMVTTSFDSLLDQCTCFRTCQTAYLSRSSPGVGFHPNHHPNQGFIRVYVICFKCVNWFQNRTVLYIIAHYLQPSPTSSPVSRTKDRTLKSVRSFCMLLRRQHVFPAPASAEAKISAKLCCIEDKTGKGKYWKVPKGDRKALWPCPQARNLCRTPESKSIFATAKRGTRP